MIDTREGTKDLGNEEVFEGFLHYSELIDQERISQNSDCGGNKNEDNELAENLRRCPNSQSKSSKHPNCDSNTDSYGSEIRFFGSPTKDAPGLSKEKENERVFDIESPVKKSILEN